MLLTKQLRNQFRFTPSVRIENALIITESVAAYHLEFNILVWLVNLDVRKAFDRVDYSDLFEALRHCGLPDGYIAFLQQLCADQHGSANKKRRIENQPKHETKACLELAVVQVHLGFCHGQVKT